MQHRLFYTTVLAAVLTCSVHVYAAESVAPAASAAAIAPQPLSKALDEFVVRTGMQVVYRSELAADVQSKGADSGLSPERMLEQLLRGTGLRYEFINANTVAIRKQDQDRVSQVETRNFVLAERESEAAGSSDQQTDQSTKMKQAEIETIVVTAQKREERLQDVPMSISVLKGDLLDSSTDSDVTDALMKVPGVTALDSALGGVTQLSVRGVNTSAPQLSGQSTMAYYVDSVPFGLARSSVVPDPDIYDLERIEVLRGPQGTLYGASALNGVVRVLTNEANLNELEFKARTLASSTKSGGENYRGDVAINVPIVDGKLAARATMSYQSLSGWIDRQQAEDANEGARRSLRFKVNAQPTDQLSIGFSAWFSRDRFDAASVGLDDGSHLSALAREPVEVDFNSYGLKIDYDFSSVSVSSATSYLDFANRAFQDMAVPLFANSDVILFPGVVREGIVGPAYTFTQEILLTSARATSWRWSLGGMYRDSRDDNLIDFSPLSGTQRESDFSESHAVFGELTRLFLEGQLELTAGLRYFEDDVRLREHSRLLTPDLPAEQLIKADDAFDATTSRVALMWHPSQQMTLYTSYSEGFRSGMHQQPIILAAIPAPSAKPDTLKNYEIGAKGVLLDGRLSFDAALYYMDWNDVQISRGVTINNVFFTGIFNGDSASGMGVDFGVTTVPFEGLEVGANLSWNDLAFDEDFVSGGIVLADKGDRLDHSAEYTAGARVDYVVPLGKGGYEARLSASANYTSELVSHILFAGERLDLGRESILLSRAAISVRSPRNWTATLFADNISNEQYTSTGAIRIVPTWEVRMRPRTIGAQFEYRY